MLSGTGTSNRPQPREGRRKNKATPILIRLAASEEDDTFTLSVSDNGSGFPSDIDLENTDTLGLRLVNTLVGQLKARLELDHSEGTTFRIIRS